MMGWYGGGGPGWGGWLLMCVAMVGFWGAVIWGIVAVTRRSEDRPTQGAVADPMAILDERLARGEIDADEHRKRVEALRGRRSTPDSTV